MLLCHPKVDVVYMYIPGVLESLKYPRPQVPPRFYLAAVEKNWEKAWDQNYVMDRKWWTQSVCNVDSVCTNQVHHFRSMT